MDSKHIARLVIFILSFGIAIIVLIDQKKEREDRLIRLENVRAAEQKKVLDFHRQKQNIVWESEIPEPIEAIVVRALELSSDLTKNTEAEKVPPKVTPNNEAHSTPLNGIQDAKKVPFVRLVPGAPLNAIQEAKKRLKGTAYTATDLAGREVKFARRYPLNMNGYYKITLDPFLIELNNVELCLLAKKQLISAHLYKCNSLPKEIGK